MSTAQVMHSLEGRTNGSSILLIFLCTVQYYKNSIWCAIHMTEVYSNSCSLYRCKRSNGTAPHLGDDGLDTPSRLTRYIHTQGSPTPRPGTTPGSGTPGTNYITRSTTLFPAFLLQIHTSIILSYCKH